MCVCKCVFVVWMGEEEGEGGLKRVTEFVIAHQLDCLITASQLRPGLLTLSIRLLLSDQHILCAAS